LKKLLQTQQICWFTVTQKSRRTGNWFNENSLSQLVLFFIFASLIYPWLNHVSSVCVLHLNTFMKETCFNRWYDKSTQNKQLWKIVFTLVMAAILSPWAGGRTSYQSFGTFRHVWRSFFPKYAKKWIELPLNHQFWHFISSINIWVDLYTGDIKNAGVWVKK
jgi:hypothetical protein